MTKTCATTAAKHCASSAITCSKRKMARRSGAAGAHPGPGSVHRCRVAGGMNGRQLAEEARKRRPDLKVLFTTAYARNAIVHDGRLDPGVELITKPFTQAALAAKLRDILDARQRRAGSSWSKTNRLYGCWRSNTWRSRLQGRYRRFGREALNKLRSCQAASMQSSSTSACPTAAAMRLPAKYGPIILRFPSSLPRATAPPLCAKLSKAKLRSVSCKSPIRLRICSALCALWVFVLRRKIEQTRNRRPPTRDRRASAA